MNVLELLLECQSQIVSQLQLGGSLLTENVVFMIKKYIDWVMRFIEK